MNVEFNLPKTRVIGVDLAGEGNDRNGQNFTRKNKKLYKYTASSMV